MSAVPCRGHAPWGKSRNPVLNGIAPKCGSEKKKAPVHLHWRFFYLGWLMGLEPTTTGITILDSTN